MDRYDLSIVIPAYNEEARIGRLFSDLAAFCQGFQGRLEIVLSDDGSTDRTVAAAQSYASELGLGAPLTVIQAPANRGKGHAVSQGVLKSRGRLVLFCDADGATPLKEFYKLKAQIDAGYHVAVGSRDLPGANLVVPQPFHRRALGASMRFIVSRFLVRGIHDTQCGFKLFDEVAARTIFSRVTIDGFSFDVEVLFLAQKLGFRIAEVPIEWHDQPNSKVNPLRTPPAMLRDLALIRLRHLDLAAKRRESSEAVRG